MPLHSGVMLNVVTSLTPAVSSNEVMITVASQTDRRHACAVLDPTWFVSCSREQDVTSDVVVAVNPSTDTVSDCIPAMNDRAVVVFHTVSINSLLMLNDALVAHAIKSVRVPSASPS